MAKVVVASGTSLIQYGLTTYLSKRHKVFPASTGENALYRAIENMANVVVLDTAVLLPTVLSTMGLFQRHCPHTKMILYAENIDHRLEAAAIGRGAVAVVSWYTPMDRLGKAVMATIVGEYFFGGKRLDYMEMCDYLRAITEDNTMTVAQLQKFKGKYRITNKKRRTRNDMIKVAKKNHLPTNLNEILQQKRRTRAEADDLKRPFATKLRKDFYGK